MDGCLFCAVVEGRVPAQMVVEDSHAVCIRDINPGAPVHVLVIPRRHLADVYALDSETVAAMTALAARAARELGVFESGHRLVFNVGPDAGQSVFHAHLHVLGGRSLAWPPG